MKYFTIEELSKSSTAIKLGIPNNPDNVTRQNLEKLVDNLLDPIREAFGLPIIVGSGYRCPKLNKAIGGATNSLHMTGHAADIHTVSDSFKDNKKLYDLIRSMDLKYDLLIWEFGNEDGPDWIHISYHPRNRKLNLKAIKVAGKTKYISI